jgi:hypothetical protein
MISFNVEEVNLICIYERNDRTALINDLREAMPELEKNEPEMLEIAHNVLKKLESMTDGEFSGLDLTPEYDDPDDNMEV